MSEWIVEVPIYGTATVFVEANNEETAIEKAMDGEWSEPPEIGEWEVSPKCKGMICHRTVHDRVHAQKNE